MNYNFKTLKLREHDYICLKLKNKTKKQKKSSGETFLVKLNARVLVDSNSHLHDQIIFEHWGFLWFSDGSVTNDGLWEKGTFFHCRDQIFKNLEKPKICNQGVLKIYRVLQGYLN